MSSVAKEQDTVENISATAAPHPEEMKGEIRFRAGIFSVEARGRTTPAGLIAAAVALSAVFLPIIFMSRRLKKP